MSVYGLYFVHAHISVSGLLAYLEKKIKIKNKKIPSGTRVYETQVPLEKIEQNRATSQTKQSM